ncbi:hypothetical protein [Citricoccus sp. I39-566]|uniref:hypothetical protein n=1 Tax=Citricoccus sp. I39-566 TaxID=3073268 RepID=UPI00286A4788|nr:hypothetical protein [Citricoccus sp. I39-566]WMY80002.1 hypothetical protein RE421_16045 [Citricoccus sp. I39-566]
MVPTNWLMPWVFLATIALLIATFVFGVEDSLVLWVVLWGCVAIVLTHVALMIAYVFGWTVWDLIDRAPKPVAADRHGLARGDEEQVA